MPKPASGKPSLIDTTPSLGGQASEADTSIRMLDALESTMRPTSSAAKRHGFGWLSALLLLVLCGASWFWWSQRARADDTADRTAQASAPTKAAAASAVAEPATAATIIATPEPLAPSATPANALPASSAALAAASQPTQGASSDHQLADAKAAATKPKPSTSARDTRVAAGSNIEHKQSAQAAKTTSGNATAVAPINDPDVALLRAMLATISRDARGASDGTPSPQAQLTIAQLVQRCDLRGVKDAIETFECKRRICDGYWGKADACPMSLSPKKN